MLTDVEYTICETQGDIFQLAASQGYNIEEFSVQYLSSDFCARQFDTVYSRYQMADAEESWAFLYPEIKESVSQYGENMVFDGFVAWWMGFTYRQLWFETGMASANLVNRIPPKDMASMYLGYHTIDTDMAADRMMESFHFDRKPGRPCLY